VVSDLHEFYLSSEEDPSESASSSAFSPEASRIPEWDSVYGLSFIQNYIRLEPRNLSADQDIVKRTPIYRLEGNDELQSTSLAVWTGAEINIGQERVPMIMAFETWSNPDVVLLQGGYHNNDRQHGSLAFENGTSTAF